MFKHVLRHPVVGAYLFVAETDVVKVRHCESRSALRIQYRIRPTEASIQSAEAACIREGQPQCGWREVN